MDLNPGEIPPSPGHVFRRFRNASDSWLINAFIELRRRNLDVRLTDAFVKNEICVSAYDEISIRDAAYDSYVVACQHDRGRPEICEHRIVQNQLNIRNEWDHYLPLWPQPGLVPRDSQRGSQLKNVAFFGRPINLAEPFRNPGFAAQLHTLGMNFRFSALESGEDYRCWSNYREVDVILAVRNNTAYDLSIKPPSKLINAWIAGCPAILGPEPAFQQLRQSELDFIEVRSAAEAIEAIQYLHDNPAVFLDMVENGRKRAQAFLPQQLAQQWRDLLAGPVASGYEAWRRQSWLMKSVGRPCRYSWRAGKHKYERHYFKRNIHRGPRLFDA